MTFPYAAYIFQKDIAMSNHGAILLIYFLQKERLNKTPKKNNISSKSNKNQNISVK